MANSALFKTLQELNRKCEKSFARQRPLIETWQMSNRKMEENRRYVILNNWAFVQLLITERYDLNDKVINYPHFKDARQIAV